jgi:hypothetical protein
MQSCPFRPSVSIDGALLHRREGPIDERLHNEWQRKLVEREKVGMRSCARTTLWYDVLLRLDLILRGEERC